MYLGSTSAPSARRSAENHPETLARVSLGRDALLRHDRDDPAHWVARLNFHNRADQPRDRQSIQYHCCLFASVLRAAAAPGLHWVSDFDSLHASPKVDGTRDNSATIRRI